MPASAFRIGFFELAALALFPWLGEAHGRLTVPTPRVGGPEIYENDPVARESESFVCRHAKPNPSIVPTVVSAGGKVVLRWKLTAKHVGDCAVFISYDVQEDRRQQRYVKIANIPDCKSQNEQDVSIDIPASLPAGPAILRWDWKALHVYPKIEWYVQCADIRVQSSSTQPFSSFDSFRIVDPPIYPASGDDAPGFRNPWSGSGSYEGQKDFFVTGPACLDVALNRCELTADWTRGYTGFGGGASNPDSECLKIDVTKSDTPESILAQARALGRAATWEEICNMNGLQDCATLIVGDEMVIPPCGDFPETDFTPSPTPSPTTPAPSPKPTPAPTPSPTPTAAPTPTPTAAPTNETSGCCLYGECGATCNFAVGPEQWCGESRAHCDQCAPLGEWCGGGATRAPTPAPTPSACSELYGQCGGKGWTGPTCCVDGLRCEWLTEWYSGCYEASSSSGAHVESRPRLRASSHMQRHGVEPHRIL